MIDHYFNT